MCAHGVEATPPPQPHLHVAQHHGRRLQPEGTLQHLQPAAGSRMQRRRQAKARARHAGKLPVRFSEDRRQQRASYALLLIDLEFAQGQDTEN